jgi:hypothetical protein
MTALRALKRLLEPVRPALLPIWRRAQMRRRDATPYVLRPVRDIDVAGDVTRGRLEQDLLFRFGFIFLRQEEARRARRLQGFLPGWTSQTVFGWILMHHPETNVRTYGDTETGIVLVGEAFDIEPDGPGVDAVCSSLRHARGETFWTEFDRLSGRFALVTVTFDGTRVLHDPFGARSVFYRHDGSTAFASHSELLALAFEHGMDELVAELRGLPEHRARGVTYLPGDWTVFSGIFALTPNNYLDPELGATVRYWPRQSRSQTSLDTFFSELERYLAAFVPYVAAHHTPVLGLTGGIDSRALIGAFSARRIPTKLVTWTGTYINEDELPIVGRIADYLAADHRYVDVRDDVDDPTFRAVKAIASRNVGRYRGHARLTAHMRCALGDVPDAAFVRGYGGEILRGFYALRTRTPSDAEIGAAELLRFFDQGLRIPARQRYTQIAELAFEQYIERAHYDAVVAGSGYELADIFYWEHRMGMWGSAMHNEMDAAMWSLTGYNSRPLYECAFGLQRGRSLQRSLLADATARYDPALAAFPILS